MPPTKPLPQWDSLSFALTETDHIYRSLGDTGADPVFDNGELLPFGEVAISPAAAVLSYGIGVFEGLKAERAPNGDILLFRPKMHARRFQRSADILSMPAFPTELFLEAVSDIVRADARFVPPPGKGTLYIRPMQHASEPQLGLRPCRMFQVLIYVSPVGGYFGGKNDMLRLMVLEQGRVAPGGTGGCKAIGNYPLGIHNRAAAQKLGYDDVLYLDARNVRYVTETSGSNVFVLLKSGVLVTPPLDDQILAGVTRDSVIRIARELLKLTVEERAIPIEELVEEGREVFCTGTAWTVRSVREVSFRQRLARFDHEDLREKILSELRAIQSGTGKDPFGWTQRVDLRG